MPLEDLTPYQIGYIAGLLDGEGCIRVKNNGGNGVISIHIASTDFGVLDSLMRLTGLGIVYQSRKKKYKSLVARALYSWEFSPKESNVLLKLLLPYLIIKKDQAEIALEWQEIVDKHKRQPTENSLVRRREITASLKLMKRKGEYLAA